MWYSQDGIVWHERKYTKATKLTNSQSKNTCEIDEKMPFKESSTRERIGEKTHVVKTIDSIQLNFVDFFPLCRLFMNELRNCLL